MELDREQLWFQYLTPWQQDLVQTSFHLREKLADDKIIIDFGFMVFPMAKAYEGFLKKMLLDLDLITAETYKSRRFRIGRALNPDIRYNQRDAWWLYDDVAHELGEVIAREVWEAWLKCRNHIFHFFPDGDERTNFDEASACLNRMQNVIEKVATSIKAIESQTNAR